MSTQKYTILDENQQPTGFLILQQPQQLHASTTISADSYLSDSVFLLVCLVGFTLTLWTILSLWISISVGMTCTIALAALKIWRNGSGQQPQATAPIPRNIKIHIESRTETGGWLLDSIEDDTISLADLKKVAEAIIVYEKNFSRPSLEKFISQGKYHKIKNEFVRMNFAHKKGNNYVLSPRAYSFLKKIRSCPNLPQ